MLTRRPLSFFGQALNNTSEQSEVSLFCVVMRSFTYVQDDKFANNVNIGSTVILLPFFFEVFVKILLFFFSIQICCFVAILLEKSKFLIRNRTDCVVFYCLCSRFLFNLHN